MTDSFHIVVTIAMLIFLGIAIAQWTMVMRNNRQIQKNAQALQELMTSEPPFDPVVESEKLLAFTRTFITQVAILRFSQFKDAHDMAKITRANIMNQVKEISEKVELALNFDNIDFSKLVYTRAFFDAYVVDFTVDCVKRLTGREVDNVVGSDLT